MKRDDEGNKRGGLRALVGGKLIETMKRIRERVADEVSVDVANRRIFVSDGVVKTALERAALQLSGAKLVELSRADRGYAVGVKTPSGLVRVEAEITRLVWAGRQVRVTLATPTPVEIANRPILSFVAAAIASAFGGTAIGELLLSAPLPPGATWDGKEATFAFDLASEVALPPWMDGRAVPVAVDVTQDSHGLWMKLAEKQTKVLELATFVGGLIARARFHGRPTR